MTRKLVILVLTLTTCSFLAMSQSKDYFRIARLSYTEGKVSFQHTDEVDWTAASINMALQPGDRIYTGDNGRAEIEFDDGSVLRLAEKTDIEVLTMREQLIQLKVLIGLCSLTSRSNVQFELSTPAAAFVTTEKGSYRFDIAENGDSDGIVRKGSMEAVNNSVSRRVVAGEVIHVPAAEGSTEVMARYDQRDAWDEWNDRRNADSIATESRRYIADNVYVGMSDLDRYGSWSNIDGYGPAWVPRVSAGWSPYWEGRWQYRPLWGWTWVSYESWGWLPYHYGRWYNTPSIGWCWLPGPSFGFHFWSPGLVRFYRGDNWVSWMPLGPGDYYDMNNYYFNFGNRANLYYLNEMRLMQRRGPDDLINRHNAGAFRTVRTDTFLNGSLGHRVEQVRVPDPRQSGRIVTGNLDVRPTSRSFAPAPGIAADRPSARSRTVVVRNQPEFREKGDRYSVVTNPLVSTPRARIDQPGRVDPARDVRGVPSTNTRTAPDRNSTPTRTYQAPQSRPTVSPQGTQVSPRNTTNSSSDRPSRQINSAPPVSSSGSSGYNPTNQSTSRSYDTGSSRSISPPATSSSGSSVNTSRSTAAPPAAGAGGAAATGGRPTAAPPASTPVKKAPEVSSDYGPRQYQPDRSSGGMRSYSAPVSNDTASRPARASDWQGSREARSTYAAPRQTVQEVPLRSSPQSSAPRVYSAPAASSRQVPQYSAPQASSRTMQQHSAPQSNSMTMSSRPSPQSAGRTTSSGSSRPSAQSGGSARRR